MGSYPQTLTRPVFNLVSDAIQLCLAVNRQVCSFCQVLENQPIHVFVGASLPRALQLTKVHRNAGIVAQLLVQRHLTTLVVGHAVVHGLCNAEQLLFKVLEHDGRASMVGQLHSSKPARWRMERPVQIFLEIFAGHSQVCRESWLKAAGLEPVA